MAEVLLGPTAKKGFRLWNPQRFATTECSARFCATKVPSLCVLDKAPFHKLSGPSIASRSGSAKNRKIHESLNAKEFAGNPDAFAHWQHWEH
eukprot:2407228-Rhodomonas_salina.4